MAAVTGKRQRGREPAHVIGSGQSYRPTVQLWPENADVVCQLADALNMSVAGVINEIIGSMPKDVDPETGLPAWASHLIPQEGLPLDDVA
jgi:hypothetical protein